MKLSKTRYDYLFLYLLITAMGIILSYFFPELVILVLRSISPLFLLLAFFLLISRYGSYRFSGTPYPYWQNLLLWWGLQIGVFCILLGLFYSVIGIPSAMSFDTVSTVFNFYLLSGLFPWPFYLLLTLAFSYFGRKNHPSPLLSALWPIFGSRLNGTIFGLGIDFYARQGILFTAALIFSFGVVLLVQWLNPEISLTAITPSELLASFIIFILLGSPFWHRFTRYLWLKRCPLPIFLMTYLLLLIAILIACTVLVSYLDPYLFHLPFPPLTLHWPTRDEQANRCLLLLLSWSILAAPIIASYGTRLIAGQTIRGVILQVLLLPCLLALALGFDHYSLQEKGMYLLVRFIANQTTAFIVVGLSLVIATLFFRMPNTKRLLVLNSSFYPPLPAIRNFFVMLAGILTAYLLTGVPFLTLFISGLLYPIFAAVCIAGISVVRSIDF